MWHGACSAAWRIDRRQWTTKERPNPEPDSYAWVVPWLPYSYLRRCPVVQPFQPPVLENRSCYLGALERFLRVAAEDLRSRDLHPPSCFFDAHLACSSDMLPQKGRQASCNTVPVKLRWMSGRHSTADWEHVLVGRTDARSGPTSSAA